ncbi:hypothetical protein [Streptomyces sp. NPDC015131]|uniref:hypothetical protein n=1 Tax=Streptomyces sp. NPDC015131 TaxID=3364941 RepID=UPI0036F67095
MADLYELTVSLDLRDDLSEPEVSAVRGHLGLGAGAVPGGEDGPAPLLGRHGAAYRVGGALTAALARRPSGGWALTSRQEVHPDEFDEVGDVLVWLAARAADGHVRPGDRVALGSIRFYECDRPEPLVVAGGKVEWPS